MQLSEARRTRLATASGKR